WPDRCTRCVSFAADARSSPHTEETASARLRSQKPVQDPVSPNYWRSPQAEKANPAGRPYIRNASLDRSLYGRTIRPDTMDDRKTTAALPDQCPEWSVNSIG